MTEKKKTGCFKDGISSSAMTQFVALRPNVQFYKYDDQTTERTVAGFGVLQVLSYR